MAFWQMNIQNNYVVYIITNWCIKISKLFQSVWYNVINKPIF